MSVSTEALTAAIEDILREELNPTVIDVLPKADPVFESVISTSRGVTSAGIGRGYQVKQVFSANLAGGLKWVDPTGGSGSTIKGTSDNTMSHSYILGDQNSFPAVEETSMVGTVVLTLGMAEAFGNFYLPKKYLEADQLDAAITSAVRMNIVGAARLVAHHQAYSFYAPSNGSLGVIPDTSANDIPVSNNVVTITGITGGRARYFKPGMHIDVYNAALSTHRNSSFSLIVDRVDLLGTTIGTPIITLICPDSDIPGDNGIARTDVLFPKDTYNATRRLPYGLNDWMKSSGDLFVSGSGLALATNPEFKSLVVTSLGAALTEDRLNYYLGLYIDAFGGEGVDLDTLITTRGVTGGYINNPKWFYGASAATGNFTMERQGKAVDMKGGWVKADYVYEGRGFKWLISPFCPEGYLYIIKLGDGNIKRYVPPTAPGSGSDSTFPGDVKFFAPLAGYKGIFAAVYANGGGLSPMVQAPFSLMTQNIPTDPRGVVIKGITEMT